MEYCGMWSEERGEWRVESGVVGCQPSRGNLSVQSSKRVGSWDRDVALKGYVD